MGGSTHRSLVYSDDLYDYGGYLPYWWDGYGYPFSSAGAMILAVQDQRSRMRDGALLERETRRAPGHVQSISPSI